MDPRNLYTLRYRQGTTGVITSYVTASSMEKASELGQWFCNQHPNRRFIRVEPAVVADEADMAPEVPVEKPASKKSAAA